MSLLPCLEESQHGIKTEYWYNIQQSVALGAQMELLRDAPKASEHESLLENSKACSIKFGMRSNRRMIIHKIV